jgi:uncharacterized membrane protein
MKYRNFRNRDLKKFYDRIFFVINNKKLNILNQILAEKYFTPALLLGKHKIVCRKISNLFVYFFLSLMFRKLPHLKILSLKRTAVRGAETVRTRLRALHSSG